LESGEMSNCDSNQGYPNHDEEQKVALVTGKTMNGSFISRSSALEAMQVVQEA